MTLTNRTTAPRPAALRVLLAVALLGFALSGFARAAESVSFAASDGGKVYADVYPADGHARATILLFHQAGSNRAEYAPTAPKLAAMGYDIVAVDARAGGSMWGRSNQTAAERGSGASYLDALPDLEGALRYAKQTWPGTPIVAWGSSYSASLVFFLAARHPNEVAALLAFSPGEYFGNASVRAQAAQVRCPAFVTSASSADEIAEAKRLFDAVPARQKTQYVPMQGVHGSATLQTDSNPRGADAAWAAVTTFLNALPGLP